MSWAKIISDILKQNPKPMLYREILELVPKFDPGICTSSLRPTLSTFVKQGLLSTISHEHCRYFYTLPDFDLVNANVTYNPLLKVYEYNAHG